MEELAAVRSRQEEFFSNHTNQYNMIRQEQKLLGKEILDVKKYQMNTITMRSSSSPQKYEPDQALMKIREQHANFSEVPRQLKEWTRNSSARECYSVWAHQQANPNLVEMPVHKVTKQIYDNKDNNRPMFYGFLKSDLPPSETAPPPPKSKDPHHDPKKNEERKLVEQGTKFGSNSAQNPTHRRGSWRLCVLHHEQTTPRHPLIKPRRGH
ncbi:hypothetical protein PIB30_051482 [Stylosanthes scabra]|uniref:Uncharacterized protein n=1 Tax=Stylosanthes scabra TaxID=79078 RepID=A0ABU6YH85_9FABA|nr:hypothetical protein [Stylosanthes scabra]